MATRTHPTVDDVLRLASEGERYELVDGELAAMSPAGLEHGDLELHIGSVLRSHAKEHRLGKVVVGEVLFQIDRDGKVARPDGSLPRPASRGRCYLPVPSPQSAHCASGSSSQSPKSIPPLRATITFTFPARRAAGPRESSAVRTAV